MRGRRIFGFVIGSLLGCGLVALLWNTRPTFSEHKILRPWQGRVVFVNDAPVREDGTWDRIRIMEDPGWRTYVRLEETLIKTPRHRGSQVTARRAMSAERVQLMFSGDDLSDRLNWIELHAPIPLGEEFLTDHLHQKEAVFSVELKCRPETDDVGYWLAQSSENPWLQVVTEFIEDPTAR